MPIHLIASFEQHIDRIRKQQSVWVKLDTGQWHHTYNKKAVNDKIEGIRRKIENLHD